MPGNFRPDTCAYCGADTWCETRGDGSPQCKACKVERFFDEVLFRPIGYRLLDWQRKDLRNIYGTVKDGGVRCYRKVYVSVPKKQGKSFEVGGIPLYHLLAEDELRPEAYGAAAAKDQAAIVFKAAAFLARNNTLIRDQLTILESSRKILRKDGGGSYAVISADGDLQDGIEPSLAILDELHRWKTAKANTLYDVITKGTISRAEPLVVQITTAGDEYESPLWFSEYEYARKILEGSLKSDSYYSSIHCADLERVNKEPDYWKSREARVLANPSHEDNGGFLKDERLVEELEIAIAKPEKKASYLRYHLNVPIAEGGTPAIEMPVWYEGGGGVDLRDWPDYDVELLINKWGLYDRECMIGIDLAWSSDLTAMACLFVPTKKDKLWRALMFYWVPELTAAGIAHRTKAPIALWIERGFMQTVPGAVMNAFHLKEKIKWARKKFDVLEVAYDPWGAGKAVFENMGIEEEAVVYPVPQNFGKLSSPTKQFIDFVKAGQFIHGNNPILNWNASCAALQTDKKDNIQFIKPARASSSKRIDGMAAIANCFVRAELVLENTISYTPMRSVGGPVSAA